MIEINRRLFLRTMIAPLVGFTSVTVVGPTIGGLGERIQQLTGGPAGNAGFQTLAVPLAVMGVWSLVSSKKIWYSCKYICSYY